MKTEINKSERNKIIEECAKAVETQKRGTKYQWKSKSLFGVLTKEMANQVRKLKAERNNTTEIKS